jgi:hypothetical protein
MIVYLDASSLEHLPDVVIQTNPLLDTPVSSYRVAHMTSVSRQSIETIRQMTRPSAVSVDYPLLTVLDVYDQATLIGKDFERIIEGNRVEL